LVFDLPEVIDRDRRWLDRPKGLPFSVGKSVEVIVLDDVSSQEVASSKLDVDERWKSLQGSVTRYDDYGLG
jgi:hypothetical protein